MRQSKQLKRCYLLLGGGWVLALVYFFVVTLPLIHREREMEEKSRAAAQQLAAAGHGMNSEEVMKSIERIQKEIDDFAQIGQDSARTIRFSDEFTGMLDRPFQLLDFDHRKFLIIDRIRVLSRENEVRLFSGWEREFPVPGLERSYLLWAQLAVMDQLLRIAIEAGVDRIDDVRLTSVRRDLNGQDEEMDLEVSVQMRLTGEMEAIHSVIMMLPLNCEELEALGMSSGVEPKSSFFLSRFILQKSSAEKPDEVSLAFVATGFLDAASRP